MPEHRGDRLQAHAAVDGLGGQRVPELVGVDVGQPGGGAGLVDVAGDGVPVGRLAVLPRQQQRVARGRRARCGTGRSGRPGAGAAAGSGPRGACRPGRAATARRRSARRRRRAGRMYSLTRSPVRSSISTVTRTSRRLSFCAARSSLAALASSSALGSGWSRRGRSPVNIGTLEGASSQPHSSRRMKNIRSVPSRWAMVAGVSRGLFCPGRAASQGL